MRHKVKMYDLSQTFEWANPVYSIYSKPMFGVYHDIDTDGFYDRVASFHTHSGTHIDSPRHFCKTGDPLDKIPLDRLVGQGVSLNIPKKELGEITASDFEKARPKILKGDIVLINTSWHLNWEKPGYTTKFPGIVKEGAKWLVEHGINMVGVNWICVDHPKQTDMGDGSWASHKILLGKNIPVIENLGGEIDRLKGKRVTVMALPVKVKNGDGFPVRVIATTATLV